MKKSILNLCILSLIIPCFFIFSCGEDTGKSGDEASTLSFVGYRYKIALYREKTVVEYSIPTGKQEWLIFSSGVFRQISENYVEPELYGDLQACNGTATGSYKVEEMKEGEVPDTRMKKYTLTYDGLKDVKGLCRMTDRTVYIIERSDNTVEMYDGSVVTNMERGDQI